MDEKIKLLIERLKNDGCATATVSDGHVIGFSKEKLAQLLLDTDKSGHNYVLIHVKDPNRLN